VSSGGRSEQVPRCGLCVLARSAAFGGQAEEEVGSGHPDDDDNAAQAVPGCRAVGHPFDTALLVSCQVNSLTIWSR